MRIVSVILHQLISSHFHIISYNFNEWMAGCTVGEVGESLLEGGANQVLWASL